MDFSSKMSYKKILPSSGNKHLITKLIQFKSLSTNICVSEVTAWYIKEENQLDVIKTKFSIQER